MKKVLLLLIFSLVALNVEGATYYVRSTSTGGTTTACTGLANADYDGLGSGEACAFQYIAYALGWYGDGSSGGAAGVMSGGDTLIIVDESVVGYTAGFTSCDTAYAYGCVTRPIPSGSAGNTTKIYGLNHASCADDYSNLTKVWGRERAAHIFDLAGNDYIDFKCLDITDKASCVFNVISQAQDGTSSYVCDRDNYPMGNHADTGIKSFTGSPTNITLDHVKITGLINGVFAQKKDDWTANYLYIGFNSSLNWDNDVDSGGSTSPNHDEGDITLNNYTNVYAGCGEVWDSRGTPYYCTSQGQSGYGDGHGTGGGNNANYTFTDVTMHHNVSDDIDNLYDDGTSTTMKVIRGKFQGSSGQSIKSAAKTTYIENTVAIGNCGYFNERSFTTFSSTQSGRSGTNCDNDGVCDDNENSVACVCNQPWLGCGGAKGDCPVYDDCRAGSVLSLDNKTGGQKWYIKNSTFYSNADTIVNLSGGNNCDANTLVDVRNTYFISGGDFLNGTESSNYFYADEAAGSCNNSNFTNLTGSNVSVINTKSGPYSGYFTESSTVSQFVGTVPLNTSSYLTDADVVDNFYLTGATNDADETVTCQGDCSVDYQSFARGASWDIGGIEYGSTPGEGGGGGESAGTGRRISGALRINGGLRL